MVAAIDIGNSNIAVGLFDGDSLGHHWRIATRTSMTPDECEITLSALLARDGVSPEDVTRCVVSSVAPSLTATFTAASAAVFTGPPILVTPDLPVGLSIATDNPKELGTDLLANAVGGYGRYHGACVVVDFGTALTVTAVSAGASIAGVVIAPGLNTALGALVGNTAQLPTVPLELPNRILGTNTIHSIQSGIMHGYRGLVDTIVRGAVEELGGTASVIATGGQSTVLAPLCAAIDEVDPWLTLDGLRRIGEAVEGG